MCQVLRMGDCLNNQEVQLWLCEGEDNPGAGLQTGGHELEGCLQRYAVGVYGLRRAGLCRSHAGACSHGGQLVGPVSIYSRQDVVGQCVEMDPAEVCGLQSLQSQNSRLSCSLACGILVPEQRSNLCLLDRKVNS